jgi:hypothetical protein
VGGDEGETTESGHDAGEGKVETELPLGIGSERRTAGIGAWGRFPVLLFSNDVNELLFASGRVREFVKGGGIGRPRSFAEA